MQWPVPQFPTKCYASQGGSLVTTGSTANTKGAWVTLASGLAEPVHWVNLWSYQATALSGADTARLIDLAIGAPGSETIVAPDLIWGFRGRRGTLLPLYVPAGATLRARAAGAQAGDGKALALDLYAGEPDAGLSAPGRITAYGVVPASSGGTQVTSSASLGVKGPYAQLTAATTAPIHALMVLVQGASSSIPFTDLTLDIAVGPSGQETDILHDLRFELDSDRELVTPLASEFQPLSMSIPAGTRLAARAARQTGSGAAAVEVAVYGFTY